MDRLLPRRRHERAPEFQRRIEEIQEWRREFVQRRGVQALASEFRKNQVGAPEAVCADHFQLLAVPDENVEVMVVENIQIERTPGSLAHRTEAQFPQPSDFPQDVRDRLGRANINVKCPLADDRSVVHPGASHFLAHPFLANGVDQRLGLRWHILVVWEGVRHGSSLIRSARPRLARDTHIFVTQGDLSRILCPSGTVLLRSSPGKSKKWTGRIIGKPETLKELWIL